MRNTRRQWLASAVGLPAALFGADDRIASVKVRAGDVLSPKVPAPPKFNSDDDPARSRWFGPFAQIPSGILVELRTTSGLTGFGLGGGGGAAAYIIDHHLRDLLVGVKAANIETIWSQLYGSTSFYGRRGLPVMAISGIDLALWDIAGKAAGKPVCELLGGQRRKIPGYYTGTNLNWAVGRGFRAFKLPVSSIPPEEGEPGLKRLEQMVADARRTIGPASDLMLDCLGRWNVPFTLLADRRLSRYNIRWFEEPLMPDELDGYAALCREVRHTRIASGEHEYTRYGFAELIERKAVQVVQPDISWSGGLTELRRIARMALDRSLVVAPHRGGSLYGLHFIAATPGCNLAESFGIGETSTGTMKAMTPDFADGFFTLPDKPGFGVEIPPAG
jgi:L-rhamnonate dehydratase